MDDLDRANLDAVGLLARVVLVLIVLAVVIGGLLLLGHAITTYDAQQYGS